jgi:hypothetical protein
LRPRREKKISGLKFRSIADGYLLHAGPVRGAHPDKVLSLKLEKL